MIRRLLLALLLVVSAGAARATCVIPITLLNGTLADATQVMIDLSALAGCINVTTGLTPIPNQTVLGNVSGVTALPVAINKTQLTTLVNVFTDSLSGAVPAGGGVLNTFLEASTHSFQALPQGSTTVFGVFKVDGTTVTETGGVLSSVAAAGTCNVTGAAGIVVNTGSNTCDTDTDITASGPALTIGASGTAGTLALGNATSGLVQLIAASGALGVSAAILPVNTAGGVVAELNLAQRWSAAQRGDPSTPTISTATFTPNFDLANHFVINLTSACPCTLANPSSTLVAGQSGMIEIHQDGTGSRTIGTWGSDYQYGGGTATITLSTAASAVDYLAYYVESTGTAVVFGSIITSPSH